MHLLPRDTASLDETAEAVDLGQSPADLVVLSFTDSDLTAVAGAAEQAVEALPSMRLASLARLRHPLSVDLYVDGVIAKAKTVVIRLLGGLDYWRYGAEQAHAAACRHDIRLAIIPGDGMPDPRLAGVSTLDAASLYAIWRCFAAGGPQNIVAALRHAAGLDTHLPEARQEPRFGVTRNLMMQQDQPRAAIVHYRALKAANDMGAICALEGALARRGFTVRTLHVAGTKEPDCAAFLEAELGTFRPDVIVNTTAFSARREDGSSPFDAAGCAVLQATIANGDRVGWERSSNGLGATDLAMNIIMPELDGRLATRAIAFKEQVAVRPAFEFEGRRSVPVPDRVAFVAHQAAALARLSMTPNAGKKVVILLNDYPGAAGRAGHAVGLDGPASAMRLLESLASADYDAETVERSSTDFMQALERADREAVLPLNRYRSRFDALPEAQRKALIEAHGHAEADPDCAHHAFRFRILRLGKVVIALQPLRGRSESHRADFHDITRPPRHGFLAFYWWLRDVFGADALIHLGAHGSLEWLPGKAAVLSAECWPEIALGPVPVVYPFIVSDPGEAAQAKRRLSAVTIGHLTPPLTEAGLHGEAAAIEPLLEEYVSASQIDPNRAKLLATEIVSRADAAGLLAEIDAAGPDDRLAELDAWLCDLKEMRIKDGLHIFGATPDEVAIAKLASFAAEIGEGDQALIEARIRQCASAETDAILAALSGRFVAPGPAGAPSRGRIDCLPTGRNLTTLDPRQSPTRTAEILGRRAADEILRRYCQDHGEFPKSLVLDAWGSAAIRTGGDELAQAFALMGVRPTRETQSDRITGFEILSPAELGRPRIDITLKISGLYRDLFPQQIALFDQASRAIADRDEPAEDNPLAASVKRLAGDARALAQLRIFGPAPQAYGTGLEALVLSGGGLEEAELGEAYCDAGAFAYTAGEAVHQPALFTGRLAGADAHLRAHDLTDQDILDAPDFAYASGGFLAAARSAGGEAEAYHLDTTQPGSPKLRTLGEEIARIVRGRMTNPRWIAGQMRHGWRGAAELAQSVDSLFAFAATSGLVKEHQFDMVFAAYLGDAAVDAFLREANPKAHHAIEQRLAEAIRRGFWQPRRNSVNDRLGLWLALPEAAE